MTHIGEDLQPALMSTANLATVGGDDVGVVTQLAPSFRGAKVVGRAVTVEGHGGDNFALHRAIVEATPGTVIVADVQGDQTAGHWGNLMTLAAKQREIAGLIINGAIRDRAEIAAAVFPVFHRGLSPRQASKTNPGIVGEPIYLCGVTVATGDLVVADDDAVVFAASALVAELVSAVVRLAETERRYAERICAGASTLEVLDLSVSESPRVHQQRE